MKNIFIIILTSLFLVSCDNSNPMMSQWSDKDADFGGVPAFDKMDPELVKEAMLAGMELSLEDIDKIANNLDAPTFENTIEEMERSGKLLDDVYSYYGILSSNMSSPEFRKIQGELAPKLSEYSSSISQNESLFKRISSVYEASLVTPLENDKQRVLDLTFNSFAMSGAALDADKKRRYAEINLELSKLYNTFSNNVLHDEENYVTYLDTSDLDGLSDGFIKSANNIAKDKGFENKYAITNTRSSMDPFLTYSTNREMREIVWKNYYSRGDNGDEYDNNLIIAEILKLRKERVSLLGHDNYAQWRLQDRMAKTPENAMALMEAVWPAAIA
ncbi:MAG: peptidyl-dipeptidase Dcp, partial [Methylophilaceae bacterium]